MRLRCVQRTRRSALTMLRLDISTLSRRAMSQRVCPIRYFPNLVAIGQPGAFSPDGVSRKY
jgi:hypothetical protein